jgi:alpha/beta superfamily hydrolase
MPAPQPLLIDAAGHTCVAWWHAAAPAVDPRAAPDLPRGWLPQGPLPLAVVLASSWGEEDMSAYDGERALALRLAEAGIGTLRFEWPDTGDSSADTGTTSIADALAAFQAAASQARALSGCDRMAFVGLRFGALLAAHAALARSDVEALVGLLPVGGGRSFVREQRRPAGGQPGAAFARVAGASFDAADLPVMLGGFALTVRSTEALSGLRWPSAPGTSLRDALLLWPTEPRASAAADALVGMGVRVHQGSHADLSWALAVAHQAGLAPQVIDEIVQWLQARAESGLTPAPGSVALAGWRPTRSGDVPDAARLGPATEAVLALSAADSRVWMHLQAGGVAVRERIVRIGGEDDMTLPCLAGVLTVRNAAPARDGRRGLLLLSAGRERRIGPHRLWVPWARQRAARGEVVLRLDIAGIGDSGRRPDGQTRDRPEHYDARAIEDIARAVAWLRQEHGVGDCAVLGLGSGAFHAWQSALAGVDVQRVVAINPPMFRWRPGLALDPAMSTAGQDENAANAARGAKRLTGRADLRSLGVAVAGRGRHAVRQLARQAARLLHWPLKDDLAADLVRVVDSGVALDFVFSASEPGIALLREEAGRCGVRLVRDRRVNVCVVRPADRTFALPAGRAELYARLDALLMSAPPVAHPSVVPAARQPATVRGCP